MRRLIVVAAIVFLVVSVGQRVVDLEGNEVQTYFFCGSRPSMWGETYQIQCTNLLGLVVIREFPGCGLLFGIRPSFDQLAVESRLEHSPFLGGHWVCY